MDSFNVFLSNQLARISRRLDAWEDNLRRRLVIVYPQQGGDYYISAQDLEKTYYFMEYDSRRGPDYQYGRKKERGAWKNGQ